MATMRVLVLAGVIAVMTTGCLVKDSSETWYVDTSGAVTWVVLERDVRSDAKTAPDREQEESEYWLAVQQQRHQIALGLQEMGGTKLRTVVLRDTSPYTVQTEAHFTGLDELGRRLLASTGAMGTSIVTRDGPTWEWTLVVRDPSAFMSVGEPSDNVNAVMNDADALHVVLLRGRFESAEGFSLSNDRRVATLNLKEETTHEDQEEPTVTLKLVWK